MNGPFGPFMVGGPRDRRLEAGQSIQLTCRVVGNPWPHVRWFKDTDQIIPDGMYTVLYCTLLYYTVGTVLHCTDCTVPNCSVLD